MSYRILEIADVEDPIYDEIVEALSEEYETFTFERTLDHIVLTGSKHLFGSQSTIYSLQREMKGFIKGWLKGTGKKL